MKPTLAALCLIALATPTEAAAPVFETPAPVAFMLDLSSGAVLYAKDADRPMPPASMAKMMTVYVAFDMIRKGELKESQQFSVRPETWARWHGPAAGSTMFLSPDERVSVENLLNGIVVLSGNDASVVLAEGIAGTEQAFAERMNQAARRLGMTNSRFCTSNGWPDEGCTRVTARDLAKLAAATIRDHPQLYRKYYSKTDFTWGRTLGGGAPITQANRDPLLGKVAGSDGLKTGHTEEAGYGFTGSAEQNGRRLVMVVSGLDSFNSRAAESVRFMEWGFRAWTSKPLFKQGAQVETAEVQGGSESEIGLVAPRALAATLPGGTSDMRVRVVYDGPLKAPIAKGQKVAEFVVSSPGLPDQRMPLVAADAVEEAGFFGRVWAALASFFA